jgi:hypothetical protein
LLQNGSIKYKQGLPLIVDEMRALLGALEPKKGDTKIGTRKDALIMQMRQRRERIKKYLDPTYVMLEGEEEEVDVVAPATTNNNIVQPLQNGSVVIPCTSSTISTLPGGTRSTEENHQMVVPSTPSTSTLRVRSVSIMNR